MPGLPPIAQSIHILSIAVVVGTIVMVNLRFLSLAVPTQQPAEMLQRLLPWTWSALVVLLFSGAVFVIARPDRYFFNPIAQWKFALIIPAIALGALLYIPNRRCFGYWTQTPAHLTVARLVSVFSILIWLAIILAGRWIAYVDYLFY